MILVTGGTGLLGSHLLYSLINDGKKVRAIKRKSSNLEEVRKIFSLYSKDTESLFRKIEWVDADILIPESLEDVMEGIEFVYHAAAFVSFDPSERTLLIKNNIEGTANIVNACQHAGIKKLLHVSSTAALGRSSDEDLINENMMWIPDKENTGYSISKFKSEMEVWRGIEEGLNAVIVNPSIIFGPGFWDKGSSSMFSTIKKGMKYYTNGVTGYVGVKDVVLSMRKLMESDISGERFIVSAENLSYKEVFTLIANALNVKAPSVKATPFLAGMAWRMDAFRSIFGFKRVITREMAVSGMNVSRFSNKKIKESTGIDFEPIHSVVENMAQFLKD